MKHSWMKHSWRQDGREPAEGLRTRVARRCSGRWFDCFISSRLRSFGLRSSGLRSSGLPSSGLLGVVLLGVVLLGEVAPCLGQIVEQGSFFESPAPRTGLQAAWALEQALVDVIAKGEASVVAIARGSIDADNDLRRPEFIPLEYASGVVVDPDGLILTNYHILGDPQQSSYTVWSAGKSYANARVKAADAWSDLAVLEIEASGLVPIEFGEPTVLRKGRIVVALGNPYATARDGSVSATWGIVSNIDRKVDGPAVVTHNSKSVELGKRQTRYHFGNLIQTDAKLSLGTSGGPLLDLQGRMVGLTTALAVLAGYERNVGYAIPADHDFRRIVEQLKQGQEVEYGFLGVEPVNIELTPGDFAVMLRSVEPGTPALKYGLREQDIVMQIEGRPVRTTDDLFYAIGSLPAGEEATIVVRRDGRQITKSVLLAKKYIATTWPAISTAPAEAWRGLAIDYATAVPPRQNVGLDPEGCVFVRDVQPDSIAWKYGIRPGVFVSHLNGERVTSPQEFFAKARAVSGGAELLFTTRVGENTRVLLPAE